LQLLLPAEGILYSKNTSLIRGQTSTSGIDLSRGLRKSKKGKQPNAHVDYYLWVPCVQLLHPRVDQQLEQKFVVADHELLCIK
jgi:hypothetical protein